MNNENKTVTNSRELDKDVLKFYASFYSEEDLLLRIIQALKEEEYCVEVLKTRHQCGKELTARERQWLAVVQQEVKHWQNCLKAFKAYNQYLSKHSAVVSNDTTKEADSDD